MNTQELPLKWRQHIKKLRAENAKYRLERNALRQELAALRAQINGK
ncbi:hypothetical protein [Mycobacterium avium]|nr:hypothetical protein [Mycobacterium avium]